MKPAFHPPLFHTWVVLHRFVLHYSRVRSTDFHFKSVYLPRIIVTVMTFKEFFSLRKNSVLWLNLLAMVLVVVGLIYGVLAGLDAYTRHGQAVVVPDVKGMDVKEAAEVFRAKKLACAVVDSTYVKELRAGSILDYNPSAGQKVKEGRVIYLTINTLNIPLCQVPDVADNSSLRQAEARLLVSGFKLEKIDTVPGEKDWVYGVKYRERLLQMGEKVPTGAALTLMVGNGKDSLQVDSVALEEQLPLEGKSAEQSAGDDESWF